MQFKNPENTSKPSFSLQSPPLMPPQGPEELNLYARIILRTSYLVILINKFAQCNLSIPYISRSWPARWKYEVTQVRNKLCRLSFATKTKRSARTSLLCTLWFKYLKTILFTGVHTHIHRITILHTLWSCYFAWLWVGFPKALGTKSVSKWRPFTSKTSQCNS